MGQHDVWYIVQCNPNCERKAVADIHRGASWASVTGAVYRRRYPEMRRAA